MALAGSCPSSLTLDQGEDLARYDILVPPACRRAGTLTAAATPLRALPSPATSSDSVMTAGATRMTGANSGCGRTSTRSSWRLVDANLHAAGLAWRDMSILPCPSSCRARGGRPSLRCTRGCHELASEIPPKLAALKEASDPYDMPDLSGRSACPQRLRGGSPHAPGDPDDMQGRQQPRLPRRVRQR